MSPASAGGWVHRAQGDGAVGHQASQQGGVKSSRTEIEMVCTRLHSQLYMLKFQNLYLENLTMFTN